jgi:hypothetical protein
MFFKSHSLRCLFFAFVLLISFSLFAQENLTKESIEILVGGAGLDEESAMNNAYQNAVKQAVGMYIDAETLVNNDEVVKDKILTHSRGIIDKVDVVSSSDDNGIYRVEILAHVIKKELEERVKPVFSDKVSISIDGDSLVAAAVTKEKNEKDALVLLEETISYINDEFLNWIDFSILGEPRVSESNDYIEIDVVAVLDFDKYSKIMQKPIDILEQISESKLDAISKASALNETLFTDRERVFSANVKSTDSNFFLVERWISSNGLQRKWTFYKLPIECTLNREYLNKLKFTINAEVKSKSNEILALGFQEVNMPRKIQSGYGNCVVSHDLEKYFPSSSIYVKQDNAVYKIQIPIEPNQLKDVSNIEIFIN